MKRLKLLSAAIPLVVALLYGGSAPASASVDPGVGSVPQGTQTNASYAASNKGISNVFATTQAVSCYRPEVSAAGFYDGPNDGYSGETACPGATTN